MPWKSRVMMVISFRLPPVVTYVMMARRTMPKTLHVTDFAIDLLLVSMGNLLSGTPFLRALRAFRSGAVCHGANRQSMMVEVHGASRMPPAGLFLLPVSPRKAHRFGRVEHG